MNSEVKDHLFYSEFELFLYFLQVKSTLPFSETYAVDPSNPPPEKSYGAYFAELKSGITGKEALGDQLVAA